MMLFSIVLWYAVLQVLAAQAFQVRLDIDAIPQDLAANCCLGMFCLILARNRRFGLVSALVLLSALHLSNGAKMAILGGPIMPDDFLAVKNLLFLFTGWQLYGTIAVLVLPLGMILVGTAWRSGRTWLCLLVLILLLLPIGRTPGAASRFLDSQFGNSVWNQQDNFQSRGLLIHLLQETTRHLARKTTPPDRTQVANALKTLGHPRPATAAATPTTDRPRNLHMIVLESFWDPMLLKQAGIEEDPIDPAFRRLWQDSGQSHALSPVFGGYTANAEFEALCGFPVSESMVFFESSLRNEVPCLPRVLGQLGYRSIASHPNVAAFWNRVNSYKRIGFDTYWADDDFLLDDLNGDEFLSDASLYRQVTDKLTPILAQQQPVFSYVLTFFGHLPYPLNERRPAQIEAATSNGLIKAYVNTIYYKSRELMAFLAQLRRLDPDGLIVLFGDHLPFLGPNFHGFTQNDLLPNNRDLLVVDQAFTLSATPLIIIDGRQGVYPMGDLPLYRLPDLLMDLLDRSEPTIFSLTRTRPGMLVRPLPGMQYGEDAGKRRLCRSADKGPCEESADWLRAITVLSRDIFAGHQHSLALLHLGSKPAEAGSSLDTAADENKVSQ